MPRFVSTVMPAQLFAAPAVIHASGGHVSYPGSPGGESYGISRQRACVHVERAHVAGGRWMSLRIAALTMMRSL